MTKQWEPLMRQALAEAQIALKTSEDVPVGALIVDSEGNIVSRGHNQKELNQDPTAHAELVAIREASKLLGSWRLDGYTLVVTLEPCVMCAGALINARVQTLVFGAADLKAGATGSLYNVCTDPRINHNPTVKNGVLAADSQTELQEFFTQKRDK